MRHLFLKLDSNIWLTIAISIFAWAPLLTPAYFFNAHDARHSIFFLVEFDQTFQDGFLWPRWSPDFAFGYGYPLFNLYAPLAFYGAEILHLAGLGFTTAIKTVYVLATIGAGLGMYGFVRRLFGRQAGLLAAVAYMYAPFHLVEIFVRSAYAEYVALAILPLVFWAFTELVVSPSLRRLALAGSSYGLLALTHHTTFFTFTPFLMVFILYLMLANSKLQLKPLVVQISYATAASILGLFLAAIYLIPVIVETRFIKVDQWTTGSYNYLQHFVYFSQFFSPAWGYGYAGAGLQDDLSFQLGIVFLVLISFALINLILRQFPHRGTAIFFLIATIVVILLMSPLAEPTWQFIPIATLVQFPWRLLAMTTFTMSIVAGFLLPEPRSHLSSVISHRSYSNLQPPTSNPNPPSTSHAGSPIYLLLLVIVLSSFSHTLPQYTDIPAWTETPLAVINWDRASIADRVGMVSVTQEQPQTSPMEPQYLAGDPLSVAGVSAGQGTVETLHHGGASDSVRVVAEEPLTLQFYTYDYPGWQVTVDGQPIEHRHEPPFGLITVDVPAGEHTVHLRMGSTPPRTAGAIVSSLATIVIVGLYVFPFKKSLPSRFDN